MTKSYYQRPEELPDTHHGDRIVTSSFSRAYFNRLFRNKETQVTTKPRVQTHARAVLDLFNYWRTTSTKRDRPVAVGGTPLGPVKSVVDLGCGLGWWRPVVEKTGATYFGIDISEDSGANAIMDVRDWRPTREYDLIVMQGVLCYMTDDEARTLVNRAKRALATGGAIVLLDVCQEDFDSGSFTKRTKETTPTDLQDKDQDFDIYLRTAPAYRRLMKPLEEWMPGLFVDPFRRKFLIG